MTDRSKEELKARFGLSNTSTSNEVEIDDGRECPVCGKGFVTMVRVSRRREYRVDMIIRKYEDEYVIHTDDMRLYFHEPGNVE